MGGADVELSADDLRKFDEAAAKINIGGARYPEQFQKTPGPVTMTCAAPGQAR